MKKGKGNSSYQPAATQNKAGKKEGVEEAEETTDEVDIKKKNKQRSVSARRAEGNVVLEISAHVGFTEGEGGIHCTEKKFED